MKPIALQLYTLRDKAAEDPMWVLKTVAETGYKGVELAGMYGMTAPELTKVISDLGMTIPSAHVAMPTAENIAESVDTCKALGADFLVSGFGPDEMTTLDSVKACADKFQTAAELLQPHGIRFAFHNHWFEFSNVFNGKPAYDVLLERAPSAGSELDVYWCADGGNDPVAVLRQHSARIPLLHIKDGDLQPDRMHKAVGSGKLDMPRIIGAADESVLKWVIVEMDNCATDMVEAVKQSYKYLTSEGLALGNK
jgi:sugar phosphate isomerase/epimerase